MDDLDAIFSRLRGILEKRHDHLEAFDHYLGSRKRSNKAAYHLYGRKWVDFGSGRPRRIYVAGSIRQKNYVSFYLDPIYTHPHELPIPESLRRWHKGKSCFNLSRLDDGTMNAIGHLLDAGIGLYRRLGWA